MTTHNVPPPPCRHPKTVEGWLESRPPSRLTWTSQSGAWSVEPTGRSSLPDWMFVAAYNVAAARLAARKGRQ